MRSAARVISVVAFSFIFGVGLARAGDEEKKAAPEPQKSIEALIRDLGSDDFKVREEATDLLARRGAEAIPALEEATRDKDPEVRWRAEKALKAIRLRLSEAKSEAAPKDTQPGPKEDSPREAGRRLRELEEELRRMHPELRDLLKGFRFEEYLPREFGRILEEIEERLQDLDRREPGRLFRDFWTFRYKDGQWTIERGEDPLSERIGVRTQPVTPVLRAQLRLGDAPGIVIESVRPGSLAARAGIERYDLVLSLDSRPVSTEADLEALARPGPHRLLIVRAGERREVGLAVETPAEEAAPEAPAPREGEIRRY